MLLSRLGAWGAVTVLAASALTACGAPTPEPADTLPPRADYGDLMVACLAEAGIDAEVQGGGVVIESTPEQQQVVADASTACEEELGYDEFEQMTPEQLTRLYDLEVESQHCLQDLGYMVDLPSLAAFVDGYYTPGAFELLETQVADQAASQQELDEAQRVCPPPAWTFEPYADAG